MSEMMGQGGGTAALRPRGSQGIGPLGEEAHRRARWRAGQAAPLAAARGVLAEAQP